MEKKIREDNEADAKKEAEEEKRVEDANAKNLPPPNFAEDAGRNFDDVREEMKAAEEAKAEKKAKDDANRKAELAGAAKEARLNVACDMSQGECWSAHMPERYLSGFL